MRENKNEEKKEEIILENTKQNNKKCKNNKVFVIIIVVIAMSLTFGCGLILGQKLRDNKKDNNTNKNESNNNVDNNDAGEKSISFLKLVFKEGKTYIGYNDGTFKSLDIGSEDYYLDDNLLYYKNNGSLYYINIEDEKFNPKKIDYSFTSNNSFSVVNNKIYYFTWGKETTSDNYAVTYDMKTKTETREKINVDLLNSPDLSDGVVGYFSGGSIGDYHLYSYDFEKNILNIIGEYTDIVENRKTTILFEKKRLNQEEYCLYDKKNNQEQFCVDLNQFTEINQEYISNPVTTKDNSILVLSDDKVLSCTSSTNCNNILYTLSDEEKNADFVDIFYYSNKLILIQGFDVECQGGCYANRYKYYDVLDNKKEYEFQFKYMGEENNYFFVK